MNKAIKAFHNILTTSSGVTTLLPADKIFPVRALQGTDYPYAVHQLLTNRPVSTADEPSNFDFAQVQVSIFCETATEAQNIAEAMRTALDRKAPGTYDGVAVAQIDYLGETHDAEDGAGNDQVYIIMAEYDVNYHR